MSLLKRLIAGILVALCLGLPARSAGESGNGAGTDSLYLTLDQLFERGLSCDFSVQNLRLRRQIAEGESRVARNALLPDVQVQSLQAYTQKISLMHHNLKRFSHNLGIFCVIVCLSRIM